MISVNMPQRTGRANKCSVQLRSSSWLWNSRYSDAQLVGLSPNVSQQKLHILISWFGLFRPHRWKAMDHAHLLTLSIFRNSYMSSLWNWNDSNASKWDKLWIYTLPTFQTNWSRWHQAQLSWSSARDKQVKRTSLSELWAARSVSYVSFDHFLDL